MGWSVEKKPFGVEIGSGTMNKGKRVATLRDLAFDLFRRDTGDKAALARQCEDLSIEIHDLGNRLHKAGLHRQGTAADVAAGMIEDLMEGLKNGG